MTKHKDGSVDTRFGSPGRGGQGPRGYVPVHQQTVMFIIVGMDGHVHACHLACLILTPQSGLQSSAISTYLLKGKYKRCRTDIRTLMRIT